MYQLSEPIATCWTTVPLAGQGIFELTQYDQSLLEVALEIQAFSWYKKLQSLWPYCDLDCSSRPGIDYTRLQNV